MRILHIDTGREMRGGQRQVLLLMRGLRDRGHASELLARRGSPLWNAAKETGFAVREATLAKIWSESAASDVLHAHDARGHTLAAIASRKPFVVSRRVAFPVNTLVFSRWKYKRARRYLAVSRFVAAELESAGIPARKIDVIYDGVELGSAMAVFDDEFRGVALASRDPLKGRALIEEAAQLAGVPVRFSDDLTEDLQKASLFIYVTRSEGLGSAALLAMSFGVPVVASRIGGLPEIVEGEVNGLLVENDAHAIAQAIVKLRDHPELRARLAQAARIRVENEFRCDQMVERTLSAYQRALAG